MNNLLTNPEGIDKAINMVQSVFYDAITNVWSPANIDGYGRVYKNQTNEGVVPQYYLGNNEFSSVLYNDNIDGHFFFIDSDKHDTDDEYVYKAEVKIVFMMNLPKVIPGNEERQDAKAQMDALKTLREIGNGIFEVKGLEKGIEASLSGLTTDSSMFDNLHPKHVFAIRLILNYYVEC